MENDNQIALREWITQGLNIQEIRNFHGDSKYLLNNMIAKYTSFNDTYNISQKAYDFLCEKEVDLSKEYNRRKFYGKDKPYIYEHSIPSTVKRTELLKSNLSSGSIKNILQAGGVALILREEDQKLKDLNLNSQMPQGWNFNDDYKVRYDAADIILSKHILKVKGAVVR